MAARIRKNDLVYIRSGNDKGKTGKVLAIDAEKQTVLVEGINIMWKHQKRTQERRGGRVQQLAPIHMSKVQPVDPGTNKGTRVKFVTRDGKKLRVAAKTGAELGNSSDR